MTLRSLENASVQTGNRDIGYSDVGFHTASNEKLRKPDHVDNMNHFAHWGTDWLQNDVLRVEAHSCLGDLIINNLEHMVTIYGLNLVRVWSFAQFALQRRPEISRYEIRFMDVSLLCEPAFQALMMDKLHGACAPARGYKRVILWFFLWQANSTDILVLKTWFSGSLRHSDDQFLGLNDGISPFGS